MAMVSEPMTLSSRIQIFIRCTGLKGRDYITKSDPFVVVYLKIEQKWVEIARTQTAWNNHNPEFADTILVDYKFETVQPLRFEVYDRDSISEELSKHDYLGWFETKVSKIMGSRGSKCSGDLSLPPHKKGNPGAWGKIFVHGSEVSKNMDMVELRLIGKDIESKNMLGMGKSDPFYVIKRWDNDSWIKVYESEYKRNKSDPDWKHHALAMHVLNNGRLDAPLRFEIFDWESSGKHRYIGAFETSINELKSLKVPISFDIVNEKKKGTKYKNSGTINFSYFQVIERHSFLEFIRGGCEMNLFVAVDFTASNGSPSTPSSLHYNPSKFVGTIENFDDRAVVDGLHLNPYQKAILAVGEILQDYDTDKKFPAFGFGGHFNGRTTHCFPLSLDENISEVDGLSGILEAYQLALDNVKLSGPTLFAEIIKQANQFALDTPSGKQKYTILLMLTDGAINDLDQTIEQIIDSSSSPLSLIIVGVGSANFESMEALDADNGPLTSLSKRVAKRDIVQFVPFNKFSAKGPLALSEEVLREVPGQMENYFNTNHILPLVVDDSNDNTSRTKHGLRNEILTSTVVSGTDIPMATIASINSPADENKKNM